jgi:hypothetical protein
MYLTVPCSLHDRSVEWLADPGQEEELEGAKPAGDWSQNIGTGTLFGPQDPDPAVNYDA